jgi:hypothetical protein
MGIRDIPRTVVGGSLKAARIPLDVGLQLAGRGRRGEAAVDRAEAAARDVAGTALGDDQLRRDAKLRRTAADERERAVDIRDAAETAAQERKEAADRRREAAAKRAAAKRQAATTQRSRAKAKAATTAAKRKQAATAVADAKEERIETRAKEERLEQIERETEALEEREAALTAADEASRLGDAAASAKAARKHGA